MKTYQYPLHLTHNIRSFSFEPLPQILASHLFCIRIFPFTELSCIRLRCHLFFTVQVVREEDIKDGLITG